MKLSDPNHPNYFNVLDNEATNMLHSMYWNDLDKEKTLQGYKDFYHIEYENFDEFVERFVYIEQFLTSKIIKMSNINYPKELKKIHEVFRQIQNKTSAREHTSK